jgi:hypothetical protein
MVSKKPSASFMPNASFAKKYDYFAINIFRVSLTPGAIN